MSYAGQSDKNNASDFFVILFSVLLSVITPIILCKLGLAGSQRKIGKTVLDRDVSVMRIDGSVYNTDFDSLLCGVMYAYCNDAYESEALKACAVAFRTKLLYIHSRGICTDYDFDEKHVKFITYPTLEEAYGAASAHIFRDKVENAVKSTKGQIVKYEDKPIYAQTFKSTLKNTRSASDLGFDLPYLRSVSTPEACKGKIMTFDKETFKGILKDKFGIETYSDMSEWISGIYKNGERVHSLIICLSKVKGYDFANALGLSSDVFTLTVSDKEISFTVFGEGMSVGMSRDGADKLAKDGMEYRDILLHYYKGCKVENAY